MRRVGNASKQQPIGAVDPLVLLANSIIENGGKLPASAVAAPTTQLPAETLSATNAIHINRGPVLTLWGACVAQRCGLAYTWESAISLGSALASVCANTKAAHLGIRPAPSSPTSPSQSTAYTHSPASPTPGGDIQTHAFAPGTSLSPSGAQQAPAMVAAGAVYAADGQRAVPQQGSTPAGVTVEGQGSPQGGRSPGTQQEVEAVLHTRPTPQKRQQPENGEHMEARPAKAPRTSGQQATLPAPAGGSLPVQVSAEGNAAQVPAQGASDVALQAEALRASASAAGPQESPASSVQHVVLIGVTVPTVVEPVTFKRLGADVHGRPVRAYDAQAYITRAFGQHNLDAAKAAMQELASSMPPDVLAAEGWKLYERFRPGVAGGRVGWGQKGALDLQLIRNLAAECRAKGLT